MRARPCTGVARMRAEYRFDYSKAERGRYYRQLARAYNQAMLDWTTCPAVERDAAKVSGSWLFRGTRVPLSALFENIEGGATVEQFLNWFPGVTRAQVEAVLAHAARSAQAA